MRRILALPVLLAFLSCGGDDLTPVESCKQTFAVLCDKIFACFTKEELNTPVAKAAFGLNASDCKVKFQSSECNAEQAKCDAGEKFQAANAQACIDGMKGLSCSDIKMEDIPLPAICSQVCIK